MFLCVVGPGAARAARGALFLAQLASTATSGPSCPEFAEALQSQQLAPAEGAPAEAAPAEVAPVASAWHTARRYPNPPPRQTPPQPSAPTDAVDLGDVPADPDMGIDLSFLREQMLMAKSVFVKVLRIPQFVTCVGVVRGKPVLPIFRVDNYELYVAVDFLVDLGMLPLRMWSSNDASFVRKIKMPCLREHVVDLDLARGQLYLAGSIFCLLPPRRVIWFNSALVHADSCTYCYLMGVLPYCGAFVLVAPVYLCRIKLAFLFITATKIPSPCEPRVVLGILGNAVND